MIYNYKKELEAFFIGFAQLPIEMQDKVLNYAGIQKTSFNDFVNETEELVQPDLERLADYIKDEMSTADTETVFEAAFHALDVDSMNLIIKDYPYRIVDKDELDESIQAAQNSFDEIMEKLNSIKGE